jgi:hypothetical protein
MSNNDSLLHVLSQLNVTKRNKQLVYLFGSLTIISIVSFTVFYMKYLKTANESISYREKFLKANTDNIALNEAASISRKAD